MEPLLVSGTRNRRAALSGCLLGTAVGDALGLPAEGLSRSRQRRLLGEITGHRLLFGRGMVSDDTEHALLVAQALLASGGEPERFLRALASELRRWILLLPAGVGMATLRACLRLLAGIPPDRSGVFSAGNGPAMRAPILGVACGEDPVHLRSLVRRSTRITHTDPKAEYAALSVALAAHQSARRITQADAYLALLEAVLPSDDADASEMRRLARLAAASAAAGEETPNFAARALDLRERVTGYAYHTAPVVLQAWLRHPADYRAAVRGAIACGGDTDTVAALVGGIVGAGVGPEGIPAEWLAGLWEWPHSVPWIMSLAERLAAMLEYGQDAGPKMPRRAPAQALRNGAFLCVVLYHGMRRALPPY